MTDLDIALSNALLWSALDDSTADLLCSLPCLRSLELEPEATSIVKALCKRTPPQLTALVCRVAANFPAELLTNLRVPVLVIGGANTDERLSALFKNTNITSLHPSPYYEKQPPGWHFSPRLVHLISLRLDDFPTDRAEAQKERRRLYMVALISLILTRANGIDRGSRLMSLPLELLTMILTPTDIYDYGLTRWAFSSIFRFLFANAGAARQR